MASNFDSAIRNPRTWIAFGFITFQFWILFTPQQPHLERTAHLCIALFLTFLVVPLSSAKLPALVSRSLDGLCLLATLAVGAYYWHELPRLTTRIENVSPVEWYDIALACILVVLLLEAVRRTVGAILLAVIVGFILYGGLGHQLPGAIGFGEISVGDWSEILAMTTSGILGITTATSVNFIFYFIVFGVVYSAVGGGQLFIDIAMRVVGKSSGGGAKVSIVGSSLMGTISGSAVANVTATGVFTIPLMKRTGMSGERAAATEAIASTGGQLMPPIMGIAAFVMAELLVIPYSQVALAGIFPALAFYFALFASAHLYARKHRVGTLTDKDLSGIAPLLPRLHMITPVIVLVGGLMMGYSAQIAVTFATLTCLAAPYLRRETRYSLGDLPSMVLESGKQAAIIAVPIAAIGIVVAVAIQSNLALKFASGLVSVGSGSYALSLLLVVIGCIVMGMGLPTVAAYIIGAILYVPALQTLGVGALQAHFFVMYFCILSMVTPPVSLASFAAAGLAKTDAMKTSLVAFGMCAVAFLIPFAFIADKALLFQGTYAQIAIAGVGLLISTTIWAAGLVGYISYDLKPFARVLLLICGAAAILTPTGSLIWSVAMSSSLVYSAFHLWSARQARSVRLSFPVK